MCVVSMVMEHYGPMFPPTIPPTPVQPTPQDGAGNPFGGVGQAGTVQWVNPTTMHQELVELRQLIAEFREAFAAAKRIDELTKQPDCEDPEKIKLVERVDHLEKVVNSLLSSRADMAVVDSRDNIRIAQLEARVEQIESERLRDRTNNAMDHSELSLRIGALEKNKPKAKKRSKKKSTRKPRPSHARC